MFVTSDFDENQIKINQNYFQIYEELPSQNDYYYNEQITQNIQQYPYNFKLSYSTNNNFILPSNLAKRDNIRNYYHINPNILAKGGVSEIYIGENNYGKFAIKCIPKNGIMTPSELFNEANISMKLKHKNIVNFYEIYEDINYIYIVMEFCENGDLMHILEKNINVCLSIDFVIDIMLQIFDVINYLHDENIIHRDLKPENFLIKLDQNKKIIIKLTDFGFSIKKPENGIKLYEILGTEKTEAPEILNGQGYNEKVDEWASGIIMYNLLTGKEVFNRGPQMINNIMYGQINFNAIKDIELRNLTAMLLNRDVSGRISAKEALGILKNIELKRNNIDRNIYYNMPAKSYLFPNKIFFN